MAIDRDETSPLRRLGSTVKKVAPKNQSGISGLVKFTMPDGSVVMANEGEGITDARTLERAALNSPQGVSVWRDGEQKLYFHPQHRNNPGIPTATLSNGFVSLADFNAAHPKTGGALGLNEVPAGLASAGLLAALAGGIGLAGNSLLGAGAGGLTSGAGSVTAADLATGAVGAGTTSATPAAVTAGASAASQAIDGSAQSIYDAAANAGVPGYDPTVTSGVAAGGGPGSTLGTAGTIANTVGGSAATNALTRLLNGTGTAADWASVLGTVGATGLGIAGADAQGDAMKEIADRFFAMGKPSLDRFNASFAPGFMPPELQSALPTAARSRSNALSVKYGNIADNPTAQSELDSYLIGNFILPQTNAYRSQNLTGAGLGTNIAGTASMAGAQSEGGLYNALGWGLNQLTQPRSNADDLLRLIGGGTNYRNTVGGMFT